MNRTIFFMALLVLMSCVFFSCKGQEQKLQCYNETLKNMQQKPVYITVRNALQDTMQAWMSRKLKGVRFLKTIEWKIDEAVFFNPTEDKAILLILERDTQKLVNFGTKENPEIRPPTLDEIQTIFAHLENGQWQFYFYTMPTMAVPRERYNKTTPMTFDELSEVGRIDVIEGYYKTNSCEIRAEYFDIWKLPTLKEMHQRFLTNDTRIYGNMKDED